jgi:hypothetical protein
MKHHIVLLPVAAFLSGSAFAADTTSKAKASPWASSLAAAQVQWAAPRPDTRSSRK